VFKKQYSSKVALQKIKQYCAYQERCHIEVKSKLYEFGLSTNEVDNIIVTLIEENYLNEERFAILFAVGKFRIKQWGKTKIQYELKLKQISPFNIKKALSQIDEEDYIKTIEKLYELYYKKQKGIAQIKKIKTLKHLISKGFEANVINEVAKKLI